VSFLRSVTAGRGADAVLEVVGNNSALNLAISLVRTSGVVSSCGVHNHEITIPGDVAYGKGFRMQFGRCNARAMFAESLELLNKVSRETPELIDGFVQKKIRLDDAVEVSIGGAGCRWRVAKSAAELGFFVWQSSVLQAV
jgi:threonine dehydrogenase-like Zn-dependent dehydrogenase